MPHEENRACLSCAVKHLITLFQNRMGYTAYDIVYHMAGVFAEVTAASSKDGHKELSKHIVQEMFRVALHDAFAAEAKARAVETPGPKEPTTSDIGHA